MKTLNGTSHPAGQATFVHALKAGDALFTKVLGYEYQVVENDPANETIEMKDEGQSYVLPYQEVILCYERERSVARG